MSFPLHSSSAPIDETLAREHECELEYALDLLAPYPEMSELTALIREAITYKSELGKTHWQSVQAFEMQQKDEWNRNIVHSDIAVYAKDLEKRFGPLFYLMRTVKDEVGPEALEDLDQRMHTHLHTIASGVHDVVHLSNEKRDLYQPESDRLTLDNGTQVVTTTVVSKVFESGVFTPFADNKRELKGVILKSTAPIVDSLGNIVNVERRKIGELIIAGPAYNGRQN